MPATASNSRLMKTVFTTLVMSLFVWLLAPRFSQWHAQRLAEQLVAEIDSASDAIVKVPLRQLADLGKVAIEPLTVAAAAERAAVAEVARQIIEEKLAAWQWLVAETENRATWEGASDSVAQLASALAAHIGDFGPIGKQWAGRLALAMIGRAERLPPQQTRVLLDRCDKILAAVPPQGPKLRSVATTSNSAQQGFDRPRLRAPVPKLEALSRASESSLDAAERNSLDVGNGQPGEFGTALPSSQKTARADLSWSSRKQESTPQQESTTIALLPPSGNEPTTNNTPPPVDEEFDTNVVDIPSPRDMDLLAASLHEHSSEELLVRLGQVAFHEAGIIRLLLEERGYTESEIALLRRVHSHHVAERLRLVEDTSLLPAATARDVLRRLLEDSNADVRLRALTALATTNAPGLHALATELATQDQDARVAELASRLSRQTR